MNDGLIGSMERLRRFRSTFNAGDIVDEKSGLTANDITAVIDEMDVVTGDVIRIQTASSASQDTSKETDLATVVLSLSDVMARMGLMFNARLKGVSTTEFIPFQEEFNAALKRHLEARENYPHGPTMQPDT